MTIRVGRLLALLVLMPIACGSGAGVSVPAPLATLRLGVATTSIPPQPNSVLWLAADDGFYRRQGLNVIVTAVNGTPLVLTGLLAGNLDVGNVSTESVIRIAAARPGALLAVDSPDPRSFYLIVSRSDIGSVADLRGRMVGVSDLGSLDELTTATVLESIGISSKSVQWVAIGDPQARVAALIGGHIDAITISTGTWLALRHGPELKVLMDEQHFFDAAPVLAKVNVVTSGFMAAGKSEIVRFVTAVALATRYYAQHRDSWISAMRRRRPELSTSDLTTLWNYYRLKWPVDGGLDLSWCQTTQDVLYRTTAFQGVPHIKVDAWTDSSVLRLAFARIDSATA